MINEDAIKWLENLKQDTGSQAGMNVTEKVINGLNTVKLILCNPQMLTPEICIRIGQVVTKAIILLNEQKEEIENLKQTAQSMIEGICLLKEHEKMQVKRDIDIKGEQEK